MSARQEYIPSQVRCQPPSYGMVDERLDELLRCVWQAKCPPEALTKLADDLLTLAERAGARAAILAQMSEGGVLQIGHTLAEVATDHDPYDADVVVLRDAEVFDQLAALSILCRVDQAAGRRFDLELTLYHDLQSETMRASQQRHVQDAAGALLLAVRERGHGW